MAKKKPFTINEVPLSVQNCFRRAAKKLKINQAVLFERLCKYLPKIEGK